MYFIEYRLDDPDTISYCIAVTKGSKGEYISEIPKEKVLCVFYHGGYESIPKVRDKMLEFAEKSGLFGQGGLPSYLSRGTGAAPEGKRFHNPGSSANKLKTDLNEFTTQ